MVISSSVLRDSKSSSEGFCLLFLLKILWAFEDNLFKFLENLNFFSNCNFFFRSYYSFSFVVRHRWWWWESIIQRKIIRWRRLSPRRSTTTVRLELPSSSPLLSSLPSTLLELKFLNPLNCSAILIYKGSSLQIFFNLFFLI